MTLCKVGLTIWETKEVEDRKPDPCLPSDMGNCNRAGVDSEKGHEPLRGNAKTNASVTMTKRHALADVDVLPNALARLRTSVSRMHTGIGAHVGLKTRTHPNNMAAAADEVFLEPIANRAVNATINTVWRAEPQRSHVRRPVFSQKYDPKKTPIASKVVAAPEQIEAVDAASPMYTWKMVVM